MKRSKKIKNRFMPREIKKSNKKNHRDEFIEKLVKKRMWC